MKPVAKPIIALEGDVAKAPCASVWRGGCANGFRVGDAGSALSCADES
jgi:hypothetical protein